MDSLSEFLSQKVNEETHRRFDKVNKLKSVANKDVETGREYVKAYVGYIHFVKHF